MNKSSIEKSLLQRWAWLIYGILLLLAVPWYWKTDDTTLLLGFPAWFVMAVFISFLVSCFTACLYLYQWDDETDGEKGESE